MTTFDGAKTQPPARNTNFAEDLDFGLAAIPPGAEAAVSSFLGTLEGAQVVAAMRDALLHRSEAADPLTEAFHLLASRLVSQAKVTAEEQPRSATTDPKP